MLRQATQKTPITALYARLSKDDEQQGESLSIENQKRILETYARDNGFLNCRFFVDDGWSGANFGEVEPLNFHDEESVVHTVLEDFYAVGTLADELTDGFHMEARGYLDREEVNARLIAFARKLEQVLDKWETHAALIA